MVQLCRYLQNKGHEIHFFANGYSGANIEHLKLEGGEEFNYKIYGHSPHDAYFHQSVSQLLKQIKPDKYIILLDTFMLYQTNFLNIDTSPAETYFWTPTDGGGGMPKGCEAILNKIDHPVMMAKFGQKQVKDYYNIDTHHIPHGVNSKEFHPINTSERKALRQRLGIDDKFVIGVVARNQPRKNLDRTIKAMRLIADKIPNAVLFLHLDPNDPAQPMFKIHDLVKKYNLENRIVYSGMNSYTGFPQKEMNNVYNLMDVFLLTTSGEGFGVPIIEAMSCSVPVIATDYTTTPELVLNNKAGLGIKLSGVETIDMFNTDSKEYDVLAFNGTMTGSWEVERGICDIKHCAEQVEKLYLDPKLRKELGENGRSAVLENYDFSLVGKRWEDLLNE